MIVSGRDLVKFVVLVLIVGLVFFYVAANRERLIENVTLGVASEPDQSVAVDGAVPVDAVAGLDFSSSEITALFGEGNDLYLNLRLERDQARSLQLELLREVLDNPQVDGEARGEAMALWLEISRSVAWETDVESLIRAEGYIDALVVCGQGQATVMVPVDALTREEVVRIADIVVRITGLDYEDITVMARGG